MRDVSVGELLSEGEFQKKVSTVLGVGPAVYCTVIRKTQQCTVLLFIFNPLVCQKHWEKKKMRGTVL